MDPTFDVEGYILYIINLNNFQVIIHLNLILRKIKHTFSLKNFLKTFGNQFVTFNKNKTNTFRSALDLWKVELNKDSELKQKYKYSSSVSLL